MYELKDVACERQPSRETPHKVAACPGQTDGPRQLRHAHTEPKLGLLYRLIASISLKLSLFLLYTSLIPLTPLSTHSRVCVVDLSLRTLFV